MSKDNALRQVRTEQVFWTTLSDDELGEFTQEVIEDFRSHLDENAGERMVMATQTPMSEVDQKESDRLQGLLEANVAAWHSS